MNKPPAPPSQANPRCSIPVAVSARHAHLSQLTIERLFGPAYQLQPLHALSQTGQYAARETVTLIGPHGRIDHVRVMGPPRAMDQIEISQTDAFTLGVAAPLRLSGDVRESPDILVTGPVGQVSITQGLIRASRHIHMNPEDAARLGVHDLQNVKIRVDSEGRDLTFGDVIVRISPSFRLELHLDTDEANAAGLRNGDEVELIIEP